MNTQLDHTCFVDCHPITREGGGVTHMMIPTAPTTAAGRYAYDELQRIYRMGKGARAARRALGVDDTRNNREWNVNRDIRMTAREFLRRNPGTPLAAIDQMLSQKLTEIFGPHRRPYVRRDIRARARAQRDKYGAIISHHRPAFLVGSEHDPTL